MTFYRTMILTAWIEMNVRPTTATVNSCASTLWVVMSVPVEMSIFLTLVTQAHALTRMSVTSAMVAALTIVLTKVMLSLQLWYKLSLTS